MQYVFMFQWPKLPEVWFSMRDYKAIENLLCNQPKVSQILDHVPIIHNLSFMRLKDKPSLTLVEFQLVQCYMIVCTAVLYIYYYRGFVRTRRTWVEKCWRHTSTASLSLGLWPQLSTITAACWTKTDGVVEPLRWSKCQYFSFWVLESPLAWSKCTCDDHFLL